MPKKRKNEIVTSQFFTWKLCQRDGVYQADGRTNPVSAGRHSLGTKSREEAVRKLRNLDLLRAVELGLANPSLLQQPHTNQMGFDEGVAVYRAHVERPAVTGGASPQTWARYRAVFDKAVPFFEKRGLASWHQVTRKHLEEYAAWLDGEHYAYRTQFIELTTIKQAMNYLVDAGHLSAECRIKLPLPKPTGTDTYCWSPAEVSSMIRGCHARTDLDWLGHILTALACTGMRISELASLRWSDLDLPAKVISLKDETSSRRRMVHRKPRQTKSRRTRCLPIHDDLLGVLRQLPRVDDGLVFHGPRGGVLSADITRRTLIRDVLAPLKTSFPAAEGDIGFADGRLHSFRHYFCSLCANQNVPEQMVMEWLGHQESKMVRHYYHAHNEEAQKHMKRINFTGDVDETPHAP